MTHYLKTEKNVTLVTCQISDSDIKSYTNLDEYSKMLLWIHSEEKGKTQDFINDFSELDSLHNQFIDGGQDEFVKAKFTNAGSKWNLIYSFD